MIFAIVFLLYIVFLGVILFGDLSQHTLILLYSGLHGVGLAIILYALFMAMWVDIEPTAQRRKA